MFWLNGKIVNAGQPAIQATDRGFLLSDGLFETLRVKAGEILDFKAHMARLETGLSFLDIPLIYDQARLFEGCRLLLCKCGFDDAAIRLTVSRGSGPRGLMPPEDMRPIFLINVSPYMPPPDYPARLHAGNFRRNELSPLSQIKTLGYLENILALKEARDAGCDDALMRNSQGNFICSTMANLFIREGNRLITPPLSDGALPGITRMSILDAAAAKGNLVCEQSLDLERLRAADEIFLTNSLIGRRTAFLAD